MTLRKQDGTRWRTGFRYSPSSYRPINFVYAKTDQTTAGTLNKNKNKIQRILLKIRGKIIIAALRDVRSALLEANFNEIIDDEEVKSIGRQMDIEKINIRNKE